MVKNTKDLSDVLKEAVNAFVNALQSQGGVGGELSSDDTGTMEVKPKSASSNKLNAKQLPVPRDWKGVYIIFSKKAPEKLYIGSSNRSIYHRLKSHVHSLNHKTHPNKDFIREWHMGKDDFVFIPIFTTTSDEYGETISIIEKLLINLTRSTEQGFNINGLAGEDPICSDYVLQFVPVKGGN